MTKTAQPAYLSHRTMARPTESPSGLPRTNKTIRIDPVLMGYATEQGFNFSAEMEMTIVRECGLADELPVELAAFLIKYYAGRVHTFETVKELNLVSIAWSGQTLEAICEQHSGLIVEDLLGYLQNPNPDADAFDLAVVAKDWPTSVPDAYNKFYCRENNVFGTYIMTRNAWEQLPG